MSAEQPVSRKIPWAPTKEDLRRLYIDQRLSVRKIGKLYDHETPNPRSMDFLITYYLKKYGIQRRDRVEELHKATDKTASEWVAKNPRTEPLDMAVEQAAVLELVRNEALSIEHLQPEVKERIRIVMHDLHWKRAFSLNDIADLIGNKTSGYVSYLFKELGLEAKKFEESRIEAIHEGRKYVRNPFDGSDEEKAYMLGLKHGDLYAYTPFGDAIRVSTSTTHPALAELFTDLFSPYGHVGKHPRYKNDTKTYEWNFEVVLDASFGFLLDSRDKCREWVASKDSTMLAYLAGLIDAEGHIRPHANPRTVGLTVTIYNTDLGLVEFAYSCLNRLGHGPLRPYLDKKGGYVSAVYGIRMRRDYWRVMVASFDESQSLLRRLPLRHREKVKIKELALSVARGDDYDKIRDKVSSLRKSFRQEARDFRKLAETQFRRTHQL